MLCVLTRNLPLSTRLGHLLLLVLLGLGEALLRTVLLLLLALLLAILSLLLLLLWSAVQRIELCVELIERLSQKPWLGSVRRHWCFRCAGVVAAACSADLAASWAAALASLATCGVALPGSVFVAFAV